MEIRMHYLFLMLFVFLFSPAVSAAEGKDTKASTMQEVVVKGNPEKKSLTVPNLKAAQLRAQGVAGGANVVPAESYKTGKASNLQDVLGYTPGVYVQPRFGAEEARLSIRGSGIQRTFHLRGIKLLQDGIPINQADGGGDFQSIEPLALQYTEVLRGANALQYGATTLGGAINFVSPTGYDANLIQGRFEAGGFNYLREQISSGEVLGPVDYFISLSESRQKGFRNHANQWNQRLFSNYGIKLSDNVETRFYVNAMDSESKLPGSLTMAQMKQNPQQPNAANITGNQKRDFDLFQFANKTTAKLDDQTFEAGFSYARKDLFHPIFQVIEQLNHDFGASFRYLLEKPVLGRKNILTLGFNPVWNVTDNIQYTNIGGERGTRTVESKQNSYNLDLYAEDKFYLFEPFAVVGGMQWSYASRKTRDKFLSDGDHDGHPTYIGLSPKIGLLYELTENTQLFTNFSRSFEPPSFGELSNRTGGGIFDLTEQTASTIEFGARGQEGRISWDAAYYYSWVENELLSLNDAAGNPLGTVNAYGTRHQGIEFGTGIELLRGLLVREDKVPGAAPEGFEPEDLLGLREPKEGQDKIVLRGIWNFSKFRFSKDPAFSNNPLPGIPEQFVRFELMYEHPSGIYFGPNSELSSDYAVDMNHTLFTYPYALLGLKGGYKTKKGLSFFVEAKNLTNEIYAATTGIIANAGGADAAQFLPGDGRTVISGVEFKWG